MENSRTVRPVVVGLAVALFAFSGFRPVLVRADDSLHDAVSAAFDFSGAQLTALKTDRLVSNDVFTSYTDEQGEWLTISEGGDPITQTVWTSGMVAGMYWYQYEATGETVWKEYAEDIQVGLEGVELLDDNDIGFQVLNSFGLGYRLAGTASYKDRVLAGADSLYTQRYVSNIPAFWSWKNPSSRPEWNQAVNVDMIMNMEIMLWAAVNGGDASYSDAVVGHAGTTWEDIVRDDYSTFHVADYDLDTGDLVDRGTYQGWMDDSTWSRGQAWAVYGFTMVYRYLPEEIFLERAVNLLSYFNGNLREDNVPYSDFDAPIDSTNPRDSSSTAIVASALLELFQLTGKPDYLEMGQEYLSSLLFSTDYVDAAATDGWEAVLRASSAAWGDPEVGSVTGDYFTLEAMASVRYKTMAPSTLLRNEAEVSVTDAQLSAVFSGDALDNDSDLSGLAEDAPVIIWLGVTLSDAGKVPASLTVGSVTVEVAEPDGGWIAGTNTVSFTASAGTFSGAGTVVESVTVEFASSAPGTTTTATIDYLIMGQKFSTSLEDAAEASSESLETTDDAVETCSADGEACVSGAECCTGTCGETGTCTAAAAAVSSSASSGTGVETCSNGMDGKEGSGVCCPSGCTQCGGDGCSSAGDEAGLTESDCCQEAILQSNVFCEDTDSAPCILGSG
ncbi:unnamed protein product [Pylaiella littoralis]